MANIDDAYTIDKLSFDDNLLVTSGANDPSIGIGYEAPVGSLYIRTNGSLYQKNNSADVDWILIGSGNSTDELVKISSNDTTAGFLNGKLLTGTSLSIVENNDGNNETVTINTTIPLSNIQDEIDNIESASGGIFDTNGDYAPLVVDAALTHSTNSLSLLNALTQLDSAIGGSTFTRTEVNVASYNVLSSDIFLGIQYPGAVTLVIPNNQTLGKKIIIKDERGDASNNTITVNTDGVETIDNNISIIIAIDNAAIAIVWTGFEWSII